MSNLANCSNCQTLVKVSRRGSAFRCPICLVINQKCSPAPTPTFSKSHFFFFKGGNKNHNNDNYTPPINNHAPPSANGRKKAVVIGISYKKTKFELKGCINDTKVIKNKLIDRFKFSESSILLLTDDQTDPSKIPTKANIRKAMFWLVQGCKPGDSLFFHFSGHGSQQLNNTGDEIDGLDEMLWPSDFQTQGMIVDDEINATIVNPVPPGVKLHAIIDACHSGTALDLPYLCRMDRTGKYVWEDHRPKTGVWKGTNGEVFFFSGCDDHQFSADTGGPGKGIPTGAMTSAFIEAIERGQTTYGSILTAMRSNLNMTENNQGQGGGAAKPNLLSLSKGGYKLMQEPQLSSGKPFDVYATRLSL